MGAVEMSKQIEVGGQAYIVTHQSPTKAFDLGLQLTKMLGEPVAAMAAGAESEEKAMEAAAYAIKALMANLNPGTSIQLIKDVLSSVALREGNNPMLTGATFEDHFRGRLGQMLNVFTKAVEFQFEDFFTAIGDAIATAMEKAMSKKASLSPSTSAGQ